MKMFFKYSVARALAVGFSHAQIFHIVFFIRDASNLTMYRLTKGVIFKNASL